MGQKNAKNIPGTKEVKPRAPVGSRNGKYSTGEKTKKPKISRSSNSEDLKRKTTRSAESLSKFAEKERIDGQDNLYIFTLYSGNQTIGRLSTWMNEEGEETESMSVLWGPDVFPIVHELLEVEDGSEGMQTQYDVTIAGRRRTLPLETFKSGNWPDFFPGITGVLDSSKEKLYKAALMQVASKAPLVAAFLTTGPKKITTSKGIDEWVFIFPDGRFAARSGADLGTFKVRLVQEILTPEEKRIWRAFQFPTEMPGLERRQAAYNYMRDVAPRGFVLLNFSHMIGAVLYELRSASFGPAHVLVDEAPPGEGKSSLTGFCRCIVYPFQGQKPTADSTFQNTVTTIEDDLTWRASIPVTVDDLVWEGANETKRREYALSLDAFSRAVFNVAPVRKRMRSSRTGLRKQRANYIQTLPVTTVEHIPEMPKSWYRRVLIAKLSKGDVIQKSDGADVVALDQMGEYAATLQAIGHLGIIQFFLERLVAEGFDQVVKKLEWMYRQASKDMRQAIIDKWAQEQHGSTMPSDWHSIGDSAAYELLYFRVARMIAFKDLATSDDDLFPHLVEFVYQQLLRMEGRTLDADGMSLVERGIVQLFEEIAIGRVTNGQRWRIDKNVSRMGGEHPPQIYTKPDKEGKPTSDSYIFPKHSMGWIDVEKDEYKIRFQTVIYISDASMLTGEILLTGEARAEWLQIVSRLPGGEHIKTEDDLWKLAEREGWISRSGEGKQRAYKITPPQGPKRVWCLRLARFLQHYEDIIDDRALGNGDQPENVTQFPVGDSLDDSYTDPFAEENPFQ